jgi:chromosome segregation ATPase
MSNTVKTTKSDEMLKSLAAQIASQGVGIFFQMKEEARKEEVYRIETVDQLMVRIEDLEQALSEKQDILVQRNKRIADLEGSLKKASGDCERYHDWWNEEFTECSKLKKRINELESKVPVDSVEESDTEEEKEAVNG